MIPLCCGELSLTTSSWYVPNSSCMILQTPTSNHIIISIGMVFSLLIYFHFTPLHGLACYTLDYSYYSCISSISQSLLNRFQCNLYYCLPYTCSTVVAIFRLILSLKVTPENLLHSRVKHSITNIPVNICSTNFKDDCYYCWIRFYIFEKLLFWLWVILTFSKFDFNGLDLFILWYIYVPKSYQIQVIHTYNSYCFIFEVSDLYIVLTLTMLTLQTSGAWVHNFYNPSARAIVWLHS